MSDRKDLVRRFNKEVFENANLDALDDFLTENTVEHQTPPPGVQMKPGREGIKAILKVYLDAFSDFSVEVVDEVEEGDRVATRAIYTATHTGAFAGIPPTGKRFPVESIDIARFEGDRIAEHWGLIDLGALLTGLGAMPPM
jgi:steroid delta-isomerase-like uncharacterized protein